MFSYMKKLSNKTIFLTSLNLLCRKSSTFNCTRRSIVSGRVVNEFSLKAKTFKLTKLPISGGNCCIRLLYKYNSRTWIN